jgi:hypothetical protein
MLKELAAKVEAGAGLQHYPGDLNSQTDVTPPAEGDLILWMNSPL